MDEGLPPDDDPRRRGKLTRAREAELLGLWHARPADAARRDGARDGPRSRSSAPARPACCSAQLLHKAGIDSVILERADRRLRARPHPRRRARAGHRRPARRAPASARACTPRACRTTASSCCFGGARHRIDLHGLTGGKQVMVYGQTEVTRDLMDARAGRRPADRLRGRSDVQPARLRRRRSRACATARTAQAHELRLRLHRRLRRLPRRQPRQRAGRARCTTFERVYPFGWLGVLSDVPPVVARADLRQPRARLRAVQHALADAQPLLRAVLGSTSGSSTGATTRSGTSCGCASTREAAERAGHRPVDREEHRAAAQLRRRADALRPPVPRRRRRAHRAADRRQGPEPRGRRRRLCCRARWSSTTASAATPASTRYSERVPAPGLEGRALLLVVHLADAPVSRTPATSARRCRQAELDYLVALAAPPRPRWPRTTSGCRCSCPAIAIATKTRMTDLSAFPITRKWPAAAPRPHPALFAAHAQRREGLDHARGDRPALRAASGALRHATTRCRRSSCRSTRTTRSRRSSIPNGPGGKPLPLFESGAILIYLADKTGKLMPRDAGRPLRDDPVADVPDGRHRPDVRPGRLLPQVRRQGLRGQAAARPLRRRVEAPARRCSTSASAGRAWIMGDDYTIADIATFPWVRNLIGFYGAGELVGIDDFAERRSACSTPSSRGRRWCAA